jgi:hypothetical protein
LAGATFCCSAIGASSISFARATAGRTLMRAQYCSKAEHFPATDVTGGGDEIKLTKVFEYASSKVHKWVQLPPAIFGAPVNFTPSNGAASQGIYNSSPDDQYIYAKGIP